ncbi:hypothetical protein BCR34DRAFT_628472 [Clohesyomyces aquaticus]|uniref:Transcription factor RfeG n=1 Tax=Clohesyomyces aquaticus TaxID=1231657 RepID=A0A1Y1YJ14_9PLEO|nr:hypothetical protein BCR34DRAFT_628472 [Clohesyomyces aquaticus]
MSRSNQWFVPGDGIAREVITADIQRYLGPDALGRNGYWITAYRTLTTQMIADLKMDSQRWQQEAGRGSPYVRDHKVSRHPDASLVAYQDSRTHAARQHWGPSAVTAPTEYPQTREPAAPRSGYPAQQYPTGEHSAYTTAPSTQQYQQSYPVSQAAHQPRTQPDPYAGYSQPREQQPYSSQQYYNTQPAPESRSNPPPPTYAGYSQPPRYFGYFDDQFLVYH